MTITLTRPLFIWERFAQNLTPTDVTTADLQRIKRTLTGLSDLCSDERNPVSLLRLITMKLRCFH